MTVDTPQKFGAISFFITVLITVVLTMLLFLGLKIFIPSPSYSGSYSEQNQCNNITEQVARQNFYTQADAKRVEMQANYNANRKIYSGQIFIFGNIFGLLLLIIGIVFIAIKLGTNIAVAFILSGGIGITYSYMLGWEGADDGLKFIVGVVVAGLLIGGAIAFNRMRDKNHNSIPNI